MTAGAVAAPRIIPITQRDKPTSRNHIDTSTLVCIQSDTGDACLFYTLDGSNPAREAPSGPGSDGRRYLSPFLLPAGRVCVRAMAATSDGRESATVTKIFIVREAEPPQQQVSPGEGLHHRHDDDVATLRRLPGSKVTDGAGSLRRPGVAPPAGVLARSSVESAGAPRRPDATPDARARRPSTTPPVDGGLLACCVWCHAEVAVDTHVCSRGHAHLWRQLRPSLQAQVLCVCCGRGNPADLSHCLTCDTRLSTTALDVDRAPCIQEASHTGNLACSACQRLNRADARYCDWCGTKAGPSSQECCTQTSVAHGLSSDVERAAGRPRPPYSAVSPGRGFWRKQLDHVCAHLRSFAQNDAPFRTLLGEPRLGRMTCAVLREDAHEVSLSLSFAAGGDVRQEVGQKVRSAASKLIRASDSVCALAESGSKCSGAEMARNAQLLQELGPGCGRVGVVRHLLEQGADPECRGSDGRPAVAVAAVNGHHAVVPLLLQRGANIDLQFGPMKNTALHEAAALGPDGLGCARVLLSCNAGAGLRNVKGLTAYDVASATGCVDMMSLLRESAALGRAGLTAS
ncbi:double zinc ribbon and ankyrin repeat-containing protein 1 isoform X3 [Syngnathus acus]|uniref:double zinc ribbon and ankyrin repeat-containing protein 1 isoform X3 n=1 Tax=Syngnathus acus TaxID=161584 RepID=UPI001885F95D|nr:double zinc ribbon and ankyrin repeat-containing protein 1 isoform X3 [Syngnathus acus]